ncbi:MAG: riboflavin synthase [Gammaproteobacteria bacterium]|jgi:riboflavin synthase|nr:riboflavin synthase [Chromatiales bacterium]MCP4927044.1 riboflavin synthase [Gammaproteobacteria bacterium]MDP7297398.1 riboflavin synthase [Gammaproteobacteria bacterium]MDP7420102.1 riboflavin synthase [Gammaproteobacteria bacterium]MDP7660295.1 riboflavin synthase [Gammaproteobacteria bacterium]
MFTGIVQAIGKISASEDCHGDLRLQINTAELALDNLKLGDSIAVNGICLTAVRFDAQSFTADVSAATLAATTLGNLGVSSLVNLERSLTLADSLGGHLVSGHVDGVGQVVSLEADARSTCIGFDIDPTLCRYVARKGSVTVDGTSLTVNDVAGHRFFVNIVPHTLERTIMGHYEEGTRVNIEVDLVARYLERLMMKS